MSAGLTKLADLCDLIARLMAGALLGVMVFAVGYQVIMRYIFNSPTFWSGELARWCMVWTVLIGFALAFRRMDHIRVDFHLVKFGPLTQSMLAILRYVAAVGFSLIFFWQGLSMTAHSLTQISPGLNMPYAWLYGSTIFSSGLTLIFIAELISMKETKPF